jgi:hypothetical protein
MKRILLCVFTSALISAAVLPCAAQDQSDPNFRKVVSALSGKWSIRETSDHGETTGEEIWQGGTGGIPLTEDFRATTASGEQLTDYAAVWRDGKTEKVRGVWCADFNDQGCTPFEVTSRDSDIEMKGEYDSKGKSIAWKEIFHITSATTFTQTLYMGAPGGELKKVSTIVAERKP